MKTASTLALLCASATLLHAATFAEEVAGNVRAEGRAASVLPDGPKAGTWEKRQSFLRGRIYHSAVWTYAQMIVWGGGDQASGNLSTGGRYDPAADAWLATANTGAPSGRGIMTAVWTGDGVLFYGGSTGGTSAFNETYYYRPDAPPTRRESAADR